MDKSYMEIYDILSKLESRGLTVNDYDFAEQFLMKENYYKLISRF